MFIHAIFALLPLLIATGNAFKVDSVYADERPLRIARGVLDVPEVPQLQVFRRDTESRRYLSDGLDSSSPLIKRGDEVIIKSTCCTQKKENTEILNLQDFATGTKLARTLQLT